MRLLEGFAYLIGVPTLVALLVVWIERTPDRVDGAQPPLLAHHADPVPDAADTLRGLADLGEPSDAQIRAALEEWSA